LQSPSLPSFLASAIPSPPTLDFSQVLVAGESAGGYMALMSGLTQPKGSIRAILAQYPMTNYPRCKPLDVLFDGSIAPGPEFIEQHLSSITPGTVISSAIPPARPNLTYALSAYGRYLEFFGNDEKLWPVNLIEDKTYMPATWIVHGDKDTAVSVDDTRAFAERWARFVKEGEWRVEVVAGEDHGFDGVVKENETGWLRDGLRFVEENWLGAGSGKVPEVL
jgi:acetyl esterase/lipase